MATIDRDHALKHLKLRWLEGHLNDLVPDTSFAVSRRSLLWGRWDSWRVLHTSPTLAAHSDPSALRSVHSVLGRSTNLDRPASRTDVNPDIVQAFV